MASANLGAASSLLSPLFDGDPVDLGEVARTRVSVHYAGLAPGGGRPGQLSTVCVCTPKAARLPNALVTERLPGAGRAGVGAGVLTTSAGCWRVSRWWSPPRPRGLRPPSGGGAGLPDESLLPRWRVTSLRPSYDGQLPVWLLGAGPGLTPAGDDFLAGAVVAAHATADPRLPAWRDALVECLARVRTTAVSRAMLECALEGYATSELADYLCAVCAPGPAGSSVDLNRATEKLLALGHSSGAAMMSGVQHTFSTTQRQGAA